MLSASAAHEMNPKFYRPFTAPTGLGGPGLIQMEVHSVSNRSMGAPPGCSSGEAMTPTKPPGHNANAEGMFRLASLEDGGTRAVKSAGPPFG